MEQLSLLERTNLRQTALKMARDINPNVTAPAAGLSYLNQNVIPPTKEKLLQDAQTIYKWLLEGETNFEAGNGGNTNAS